MPVWIRHDFSRIPVLAKPRVDIPLATIGDPSSERIATETEKHAHHVLGHAGPRARGDEHSRAGNEPIGRSDSGDQVLTVDERAYFGGRLGHDFSRVRLHFDATAAEMARALNAEAFTVGTDIYFGAEASHRHTDSSDRLLFHELAHVAQQSRTGPAIQPKLKFTGSQSNIDRVIALLNTGLEGYSVSESSGQVELTKTESVKKANAQQQALSNRLYKIIHDPNDVTIGVSAGSKTLGGTFKTRNIDIADLEVYGVAGLIHEIEEQFQGQTKGLKEAGTETTGPHSEGMKAESEVMGAKRGPQKVISLKTNFDKSIDATLEIPFTYPNGKVKVKVMKVVKSNIVSFEWK